MQRRERIDAMPVESADDVFITVTAYRSDKAPVARKEEFVGREDEIVFGLAVGLGVVEFECFLGVCHGYNIP